MAVIAKSGTPSLATPVPCSGHRVGSGLLAGEAIAAGDACYIKGSDGRVWRSIGTAVNAAAKVDGFAAMAAAAGEAVTLFVNVEFHYGAALTPGTRYYLFTTAGQIGDAATTGGTGPIAHAIDASRIRVYGSMY